MSAKLTWSLTVILVLGAAINAALLVDNVMDGQRLQSIRSGVGVVGAVIIIGVLHTVRLTHRRKSTARRR